MKKLLILACLWISSVAAVGQAGYFGVGTFSQKIFTNSNAPAIVAITNIGQSSHWLTFCVANGTYSVLGIQLEGSYDGSNWFPIADPSSALSGCQVLEASGYFPQLRADFINSIPASGTPTVTAWYSATQTAISSSGIGRTGKSSVPVTSVPDFTFSNTNLKSTPQTLSTSAASIYEISVFNPNAGTVYVVITGAQLTSTTTTSAVYGVAAGASRDIHVPNGFQIAANGTVACATAATGVGDPATGCVVTIHQKGFTSMSVGGSILSTAIPN